METHFYMQYHLEKAARFIQLPICWTDLNFTILGANQAFFDLFGARRREQIINKSYAEFFPLHDVPDHLISVVETRKAQVSEEQVKATNTGQVHFLTSTRSPLVGPDGAVAGVVCIAVEITAEQYAQGQKPQSAGLRLNDREEFGKLAQKVAHDIQSPLSALSVMLNNCDELNEKKRLILKNAFTAIKDIANNILTRYTENQQSEVQTEQRRLTLCSDFLLKLISERKFQYQHLPIKFEIEITANAQFAFICVQPSQFGRAISNIISNAVDALKESADARVIVKLDAAEETVSVTVKDSGCGMPAAMRDRILTRSSYTSGKENGHGIGMMQVWDMVDSNEAAMSVDSQPGEGTTFTFTFSRSEKAKWLVDEIDVRYDDIIVILDDDQLIHDAWDIRLNPLLQINPQLFIRHERNGQATIDYVASLSPEQKSRVQLFCDYELINQNKNGLQVIEACQVERKFLVTSYYHLTELQEAALDLRVKMLPKQMALIAPMFFLKPYGVVKLNIEHVIYDKNFYNIEQLFGIYSQEVAATEAEY